MNPNKLYTFYVFIFPIILTAIVVPFCDYIYPAFYTYDMCSKEYSKLQSNGQPTFYDQPNSKEMVNDCYQAKNTMLNPFIESITLLAIIYPTIRYLVLGSKSDFIKNNPDPKWRWEQTERRSPI